MTRINLCVACSIKQCRSQGRKKAENLSGVLPPSNATASFQSIYAQQKKINALCRRYHRHGIAAAV